MIFDAIGNARANLHKKGIVACIVVVGRLRVAKRKGQNIVDVGKRGNIQRAGIIRRQMSVTVNRARNDLLRKKFKFVRQCIRNVQRGRNAFGHGHDKRVCDFRTNRVLQWGRRQFFKQRCCKRCRDGIARAAKNARAVFFAGRAGHGGSCVVWRCAVRAGQGVVRVTDLIGNRARVGRIRIHARGQRNAAACAGGKRADGHRDILSDDVAVERGG